MHVAVNAVSLRVAGGRSVAMNFLRAFEQHYEEHTITLFAPADAGYEEFNESNCIRVQTVPVQFNKSWLRPFTDYLWLSRQIEACEPDVIFSMGNFAVPSNRKQVVIFMWPYATYPDSEVWERMSWLDRWAKRAKVYLFRKRMKYATVIAPQTQTSADRLNRYYPQIRQVKVVPTAVTLNTYGVDLDERRQPRIKTGQQKLLLCLTHYYPHKNLEILLALAQLIKLNERPFNIITTIAPEQHPDAARFLGQIREMGLEDIILNIGPVPMDEVPALYGLIHGLLLPTLLESFSGTYVDAIHFKKPIFTSDRDFARDVCGDHAFYFDPHAAQNILNVIEYAFTHKEVTEEKTRLAAKRLEKFPNWHKVAGMYLELMQTVV